MSPDDLKNKIAIILSQVGGEPLIYNTLSGSLNLLDVVNLIAEPGQVEVVYEPLLLLRTLFAQCPPELKPQFVPLLLNQMTPTNAIIIGHVVVDAGELRRLRPHIQTFTRFYRPICKALDQKLAMESHRFSESDLDWIEEAQASLRLSRLKEQQPVAIESPVWWLTRLKSRIERVRYLRLKKELFEGHNPEINTDKQLLISRLETLGFRKEIVTALQSLDVKLYAAGTPLDYKGCMEIVRTIYEEITEDAAKKVATIKGKPPLTYSRPFQPWAQYLETEGVVTGDERELVQKLYNYLSNAGAHTLGSAPEQVRVSRNMVIELGLMMVGRVENVQ
jgi:hypothetical protein